MFFFFTINCPCFPNLLLPPKINMLGLWDSLEDRNGVAAGLHELVQNQSAVTGLDLGTPALCS